MAKQKNKNEFSEKNALKLFTKATVDIVNQELKNIGADEMISSLYFNIKDEQAMYLLKQYEKQLILCKLDYERFKQGLHVFFLNMERYIKDNKLYKKFFELAFTGYITLCKKQVNRGVLNAFFDLYVQQYAYFGGGTKHVVYGLSDTNKSGILTVDEVGRNLTEINFYLHQIRQEPGEIIKLFRRFGHKDVIDGIDINCIILKDQIITNNLFMMTYFISEENDWLFPYPYRDPTIYHKANPIFYTDSDDLKDRLKLRQRMQSHKVTAHLQNCRDIISIELDEVIKDNSIIMIYKVKFEDNTYTSGFYSTKECVFYGAWKESSEWKILHTPIERMVLELYTMLTCNLNDEETSGLINFIEINKAAAFESKIYPLVNFEISRPVNCINDEGSRNFDKNNYKSTLHFIDSYTRKLPMGQLASEDAKEMARQLGIELPADRTFVSSFRKKVYTKGDVNHG